ncbi:sarcosine oxidase subunit gamma family protein [Bradyrhizobium sp. 31Argb]|uniref:sarcosine oxidase subunit gamma n=1 Tax=unclassified Bradyrhizobium TaxID=2631580 RepID=UPI00102EAFD4|nr:sarcosine oxidase subunit gamma family protein [Bradyrhizobium sp. Leo170]TAI64605.1 sarcosine oxidase subunit gamma [Bradyrhizobium sp. Leo170]
MAEATIVRVNSLAAVSRDSANPPRASLAVLPDAAKLVFRGRPPSVGAAAEAFGVELPQTANRFSEAGPRKAYWLGPDEWLLEAIGQDSSELFSAMAERLASHSCSLVDVSHRSDSMEIRGPMSEYVLNHGCPLDLSERAFPIGMCTRTILGKSPIILSRTEREVFHLDVWRSFSPYVWLLLDDARREFLDDESARSPT